MAGGLGNDVPADGATMGEIVMRGNNVMKGYFEDEEATAEAFRGGWFHSGDLGVVHPDGYVQLLDRAKSTIARYKAPTAVAFLDELPTTSTGKVPKFELRELERAGQDSRI